MKQITTDEAARLFKVSKEAIIDRINAGTLKGEKSGKMWYIEVEDDIVIPPIDNEPQPTADTAQLEKQIADMKTEITNLKENSEGIQNIRDYVARMNDKRTALKLEISELENKRELIKAEIKHLQSQLEDWKKFTAEKGVKQNGSL